MIRAELESRTGRRAIRVECGKAGRKLRAALIALLVVVSGFARTPDVQPAASPSPTPAVTRSGTPAPSPTVAASAATAEAGTKTSAGQFPGYQFSAGQRLTYRVDYSSISNADLRSLFQDQNIGPNGQRQTPSSALSYSLVASFQSEMALTTVKAAPGSIQVLYAVRDPIVRLVINSQAQTQLASNVARDLGRGFLVELTAQGKIVGVYMQPDAGKFSQDFARTLLATTQFVFPATPPPDGQSWIVREEDRSGTYLARYRIVSASVAGHRDWIELRKSKVRYLPDAAADDQPIPGRSQAQKKLLSKMDFAARFDLDSGSLVSLGGTETQDTSIQDKNVAHSETTMRFSSVKSERVPGDEMERVRQLSASLTRNSSPLTLFARRSRADVEANVQRSELGSATPKELLNSLAALKTTSEDREQQQAAETPLYLKFKALVYVHPESCTELQPVLDTADAASPAFRIIAGALGAVGHAQAQRVLVHAIQARPQDSAALPNLISTLGSVPHPTVETEKAIKEVAASSSDPNVSGTAILALGSMARNLEGKDPQRAAAIVSHLLQRTAAAHSEEETQHLLQALGNTGSSRAMPLLSQFASSPSPVLRAAAVDALRSIRQPQADALLLHTLVSDADAHVRLEAAFALGFRRPSREAYDAQSKVLATEGDEKVRAALLNNLAKMYRQFPEVRNLLEQSAAKDPSEYVRKAAAGLLQQMSKLK